MPYRANPQIHAGLRHGDGRFETVDFFEAASSRFSTQSRVLAGANLYDRDFNRDRPDHRHSSMSRAIPSIHNIARVRA
jgi:hypothetical protein